LLSWSSSNAEGIGEWSGEFPASSGNVVSKARIGAKVVHDHHGDRVARFKVGLELDAATSAVK
jgi:hypothetical protein